MVKAMIESIQKMVADYWESRIPLLLNELTESALQLENFLILESYYRSAGKKEKTLQKSFGNFGQESLDLNALSGMLQKTYEGRGMEKARFLRMQGIFETLKSLKADYAKTPPACALLDFPDSTTKGVDSLLETFETHITPHAEVMKQVRMARLEARGRYLPEEHDDFFKAFNWRHLDTHEIALCPPFVVLGLPEDEMGPALGDLIRLMTSGRPIKLILNRSGLAPVQEETGRVAAMQGVPDLSLLFLSLRNVFFLQTSPATPHDFVAQVARGLDSPRPAIFSLLGLGLPKAKPEPKPKSKAAVGSPGKQPRLDTHASEKHAQAALLSRAFPHFIYDPDKAEDFVSCLDLSDNPELESVWPGALLEYKGEDGLASQMERPYTFADFAVETPEYKNHFSPLKEAPNEEPGNNLPLVEYLGLSPDKRRDKAPYVHALDKAGHLVKMVPSQAMLAFTIDRMHLWRTLQEMEGIRNPYVQAAEQLTSVRLTAEMNKALAQQKSQLETEMEEREHEAVSHAMKNLAARLTGLVGGGLSVSPAAAQPGAAAKTGTAVQPTAEAPPKEDDASNGSSSAGQPAEAEPEPAAGPISEQPWIDERLCTTCDECTALNKHIFAYNGKKKAYIKDAKAGPFKDIVKAAEKCASGAIHPGLPLNPAEKDLEKFIKRAEPFQ